jgi:hypothetical protein
LKHFNDYINLRLELLIDPALCDSEPGFEKIRIQPVLLRHNIRIMQLRDRMRPGITCPNGFPQSFPCYRCPIGYSGPKGCPAACHRLTYVAGFCPRCKSSKAAFDTDLSKQFCVDCFDAAMLRLPVRTQETGPNPSSVAAESQSM